VLYDRKTKICYQFPICVLRVVHVITASLKRTGYRIWLSERNYFLPSPSTPPPHVPSGWQLILTRLSLIVVCAVHICIIRRSLRLRSPPLRLSSKTAHLTGECATTEVLLLTNWTRTDTNHTGRRPQSSRTIAPKWLLYANGHSIVSVVRWRRTVFFRRKFSRSSSRYREIYCRGDNLYRLACSIWKLKFTLRRIAEMRNNWEIFTRNDVILTMLIRRTCEDLFEFFRSMAPFKRDIFLAECVGRDTRQEFGPGLGLRSNLSDLCPTPICLSYFVM
jgi:hypothetical protein